MLTLQQFIEAYAAGGADAVRAALAEANATDEDLARLIGEARTGFADLFGDGAGPYSAEDADAMDHLAAIVEAFAGEETTRTTASAETTGRVQDLAQRVLATDPPDVTDAPAAVDDPAPSGDAEADPPATDAAVTEPVTEPVTPAPAAARRVDVLARLANARAGGAPRTVPTTDARFSLVAAAEVPGTAQGSEFADVRAVSMALIRKLQSMPKPGSPGAPQMMQSGLAVIRKEFPEDLIAKRVDDWEVLDRAADETRLPGNSLVAAGGWCAPSEQVYGFFELDDTDGMLSVPETQWARGGINFTRGPEFAAIYSAVGFAQTEAQAIAEVAKTCYEVPCGEWDEVRLDIMGLCIKAGILLNAAYPELVDRYIRGAMNAQAHKVNASKIARIVALSTAVDYTAAGDPLYWSNQGATSGVLEALELQVTDYRYKHRMTDGRSLEAVAPRWLRPILRADLSKRTGIDIRSESNAALEAHFAARNVHIQWVYDWQDAMAGVVGGIGGATAPTAWPAEVDVLLYAAGTFVVGTNDVITLDAGIYDSVNIMTNKFNALFTEEGIAVAMRGFDSRLLTIPVCANGTTAIPASLACGA